MLISITRNHKKSSDDTQSRPTLDEFELVTEEYCISTFDEFAFFFPERNSQSDLIVEPMFPWKRVLKLPDFITNSGNSPQLSGARMLGGNAELWVRGDGNPILAPTMDSVKKFYLFNPESMEWETVSANVLDTKDVIVGQIFISSDGSIWGRNVRSGMSRSNDPLPLLSKFNEETRRFQFVPNVIELPLIIEKSSNRVNLGIEILLSKDDVFWFFVFDDGIYSYNPSSSITTRHRDLPQIEVAKAIESSDGNLYFYRVSDSGNNIEEDTLSVFNPTTGELASLAPPDEFWPSFSGIALDKNGDLWLGSVAKIMANGTWELLYPNVEYFFDNVQKWIPVWAPPRVLFESSDGKLWFLNYRDTDIVYEGLAWFDPKQGTGCYFTNIATQIVEIDGSVWLIVDGSLFRYKLPLGDD